MLIARPKTRRERRHLSFLIYQKDQSATGLLDSVESKISHSELSYVQESY